VDDEGKCRELGVYLSRVGGLDNNLVCCHRVFQSVCLSVARITAKVVD